MNKWLNRAVGTVGVAGGMLLLGAGAAHADSVVPTTGTLDDVFRPAPADSLGLTVDTPGSQVSTGMVDEGPLSVQKNDGQTGAVVHTPGENGHSRDVFASGRLPDLLSALPSNDLMPGSALGVPQQPVSTGKHAAGAQHAATEARSDRSVRGAPALPVLGTLSSLPLPGNLPVLGNATKALPTQALPTQALGSQALPTQGMPTQAQGSQALPAQALPAQAAGSTGATEGLPGVGSLPLVGGNLPVLTRPGLLPVPSIPLRGNVKPVNDMTLPLGQTESIESAGATEVLHSVPFFGDVLQNNSVRGVPVLDQLTYSPRHAGTEGIPAVSGLPLIGGLSGGPAGLPLVGSLLGGGGGLLPG
jgi:hypothetical protein